MHKLIQRYVLTSGIALFGLFIAALPAQAGVPGLQSAKITGPNTITVTYSEPVNANAGDYSNFTGSLASRSVASLGGNGTNTVVLTLNGDPLPANSSGYMTIGSNTLSVSDRLPFPGGSFNVADAQAPSLVSMSVASLDGVSPVGKLLKGLNINFTTNETIFSVSASVMGHPVATNGAGAGPYMLAYTPSGNDVEGTVPVSLTFTDAAGNVGRASFSVSGGASSATTASNSNLITSNANTPGVLKIGDSITFTLMPQVMQPNARVNGSYNGTALSWYTTNGGVTYTATYVVSSGNADQPYPLQISGVTLTDQFGAAGAAMNGTDIAKTIVASAPSIYEITPVPTIATTATPNYAFQSSKAGTIRYGGDCTSGVAYAYAGANTVQFNALSAGMHTNCTILVTDAAGNMSNQLTLAPFTIQSGATAGTVVPLPTPTPTPSTPTATDLAAQLAALQSQLLAAQNQTTTAANKYTFTKALNFGDSGTEVLELQKRLAGMGYLTATPNGYFGPATQAAVKAFQRDSGLSSVGFVGPGTRAALNR